MPGSGISSQTSGQLVYALGLQSDGTVYFGMYNTSSTWFPLFTALRLPLNAWTHLGVTFDGTNLKIYFNGTEVAGRTVTGTLVSSTQPQQVGDWLTGDLDEVRIYRRALGATEIALDMATPVDPTTPFQVTLRTPADYALGVLTTPVTAAFSRAADPTTVTTSTFELRDYFSDTLVPASVGYNAATRTATLTPTTALAPLTYYIARIVGGSGGITDSSATALSADVTWIFSTAADSTAPSASYSFSEGVDTETADWSGNWNTAMLMNGTAWTSGVYGNGLLFDGVNDAVQITPSETLILAGGFTFETWINPTAPSSAWVWSQLQGSGNQTYTLALAPSGVVSFTMYTSTAYYPLFTTATLPLNTWTHLAVTYDGTNLKIYFDGVEVAARTVAGTLLSSTQPHRLGDWLTGMLDETRIYRRALSPSEIAADMQSPVDPQPVISSLTPTSGAIGQAVTIAGTNLGAQESGTVTFNGTDATVTSWTPTSIVVTVPAWAGTGPVVVTNQGVSSNSIDFTVLPTPAIAWFDPTTGAAGQAVMIFGTNFGATQGAGTVTFNGTVATTITSWSDTSIGATVPVGASTGPVVVTALGVPSNGIDVYGPADPSDFDTESRGRGRGPGRDDFREQLWRDEGVEHRQIQWHHGDNHELECDEHRGDGASRGDHRERRGHQAGRAE